MFRRWGCPMIRMGVSGWVFLLVPEYPGCPGPKAVKRLCVCVSVVEEILREKLGGNFLRLTGVSSSLISWLRDVLNECLLYTACLLPVALAFSSACGILPTSFPDFGLKPYLGCYKKTGSTDGAKQRCSFYTGPYGTQRIHPHDHYHRCLNNVSSLSHLLSSCWVSARSTCLMGDAENARHEIAGYENAAPCCRGGKCETWKCEKRDSMEHHVLHMSVHCRAGMHESTRKSTRFRRQLCSCERRICA